MLHSSVSPQTLGFARLWVFGLWFWNVAGTPFADLALVPAENFTPHGVLRLIPDSLHATLLSPAFLRSFKLVLLWMLGLVALGFRPYRGLALLTSALLTLHAGMIQGFGPVTHGDIPLLLAAWVLAVFPAADAFALGRSPARLAAPEVYRAPLILLAILFTLFYAGVGVHRFGAGGLGIFTDESLIRVILLRSIEDAPHAGSAGLAVVNQPLASLALRLGYFVVTVFEVLSPLVLFSRRFRRAWLAVLVLFHFLTLVYMKIFFFWNLMLMPVVLLELDRFFAPRPSTQPGLPILFFDGECGLCNRFVRWLLRLDRNDIFRFASLQGETARARGVRPAVENPGDWSLVLLDEAGVHESSAATLRAIGRLGAGWNAALLLMFVPRSIREFVYRSVARNRYRWFGKVPSCELLGAREKRRLLP